MSKKRIFFLMLGALSMAACVSKRKYLELETAKFQADEQIKNLTNDNETLNLRIANLTSGFEQMKQELMASNARKDQLINELNGQILRLTTNVRDKETSLEKNQFTYSFEKRQMEAEVAKSKQEAAELAAKYKALQTELTEV
ncbi:MAG: hypothetical protein LBR06_07055, partial [Bacteroidales bacterium]|nr:hypothetical protein [Bacteroidales bacterium]